MAFVGTEGWKSGLSSIQVAKVEELESKFDHLKKENGRKQLHLDNLQQELEKNKRKVSLFCIPRRMAIRVSQLPQKILETIVDVYYCMNDFEGYRVIVVSNLFCPTRS